MFQTCFRCTGDGNWIVIEFIVFSLYIQDYNTFCEYIFDRIFFNPTEISIVKYNFMDLPADQRAFCIKIYETTKLISIVKLIVFLYK